MSVAQDLLALLEGSARRRIFPVVRALHLPPPDARGKSGEFCAVELEDGSLGLGYVLLGDTLAALHAHPPAVAGRPALEVARGFTAAAAATRAVGFAAVNALTHSLLSQAGFTSPPVADSLGGLAPAPGDRIGMVGLFPPLVAPIVAAGARLTVIERRPELVGAREGWHVTLDPAALASCNKVLTTSTVLLNDTLESILAHCRDAEQVAMIGPGAACPPDPLFARGITLLGGAWIVDREGFLRNLAAGESWSRYTRKFALTPANYPGWRALVG